MKSGRVSLFYIAMSQSVFENIMGIYNGTYQKTIEECIDEVESLIDYYDKKLEILRLKKEAEFPDIRMHNMVKSAYDLCYHTIRILDTLSRDLKDPNQIEYFRKQREKYEAKPVKQPKINHQAKLF